MVAVNTMGQKLLLLSSLAAYLAALALPALHGEGKSLDGLALLLLGWVQVGGDCSAWLANLTFFAACTLYAMRKYRASFGCCLASVLVGLDTFRATYFSVDSAGYHVPIQSVGTAFYVWQASFVLLAIGSVLGVMTSRPAKSGASGTG